VSPAAPPGARGLSEDEAARRLSARGEREPLPSSRTAASIVRANTLTLFNLILAVFFVVVVAAGRPADGLFLGVLIANTGIGIVQELRAKRTLDRAALLVAPRARVVRDAATREVPVEEVVDGDLVLLHPGDQVVADGSVTEAVALMLDESQLSGEAVPVPRAVGEEILSGAFCVEGRGAYVATATGHESYAARLLGEAREQTQQRSPLEIQINRLLRILVAVMIPLGIAFIAVLINRHVPFRDAAAVSTAGIVTLVPEGLVLLTSLTFAVAAAALTRRGMLVQYLNAVESLANVDTVCVDKTGTLTDGELALRRVIALDGEPEDAVRRRLAAFAASSAAPNDTLASIVASLPGEAAALEGEVPFSSRWKWSAARLAGDPAWLVLGAPDVLLTGAQPDVVGEEQRQGRRVLVFGEAADVPLGEDGAAPSGVPAVRPLAVVVLQERIRADAADTIAFLRRQGVAIRVMSGDSAVTVAAIAAEVGVDPLGEPVEGDELPGDGPALRDVVRTRAIFARLSPQDKRRLIDALVEEGAYTAMMGDGVNDVPAMKRARLAIALGGGSQLAKSVSDAVLVDGRFGAIPEAIGEGRRIIGNVQRVAKLFVTKSVFAAVVIATFGLITSDFPLLPRHLSLAGAFTVGIPGFLLALAPGSGPVQTRGFLRDVARFALPAGTVMAAAVMLAYLAVADVKDHTASDGRTAATTVFVAVGIYLLLVLDADRMERSRRYAALVVAMAGGLMAGYLLVLGSDAGRSFFALERPGWWELIVTVASVVLAIRLLAWLGLSPYRGAPAADPAPRGGRAI
jgi:cation-transporting ATPase E